MSRYADELEALSNAATVGPWTHEGRKGFDLDHAIMAEGQVVATLGDAIYHDSPSADLIVSLANHADDFVRLLRAAESLLRDCGSEFETTPPCSGCFANMAAALAAFEEENHD